MVKNEPMLPAKLASKEAGAGLPPVIPEGMRAVSVRVNDVIGVAGYVLPGTRVDVVATASPTDPHSDTTTKVILSNVQVVTAGTRMEQDQDKGKPVQVTVVTLLVEPGAGRAPGARQHRRQDSAGAAQPARPGRAGDARHQDRGRSSARRAPRRRARRRLAARPRTRQGGAGDPGAAGARADADRRSDSRRQAGAGSNQVVAASESRPTGSWTQLRAFQPRNHNMTSAYTTEPRRLRRATNGRPATTAALVVAIIVILVAAPRAQQPAPTFAASAAAPARPRPPDGRADRRRPAGRPLDGAQRRLADRARLADGAGHRRRDGDRADAAADPRQAARHHLAVRVGPRRRDQDLRGQGPPRPDAARRRTSSSCSPARRITVIGSGKDVVISGHGLEQVRHREGRGRRRRLRREEGERRQPAEAAGRRRLEPGDAARALRGSEPQRDAGARRARCSPDAGNNDWFARTTTQQFPAPFFDQEPARCWATTLRVQRLPEPVPVQHQGQHRHRRQGAVEQGAVPEPGRAEPDRAQRQGSELPRRRRVSRIRSSAQRQRRAPSRSCSRSSASA